MKTIKTKYYPAYVGQTILPTFDFEQFEASSFIVVTDTNVQPLVNRNLLKNPRLRRVPLHEIAIPAGEASKSMAKAEKILRYLALHNIDRQAVILAVGGGVVGDLAGFVSSVYKRGINYVQVPTTLLAQVDSAHGGKTGINLPEGKNLVGTTYFPLAVIADTEVLQSLPPQELTNGLAEIIKYAVTTDAKLFTFLEKHIDQLTPADIENLIVKSINIKAKVSEKDPEETEYRKILNYGHTIGHALETATNHKLNHGQAVALGMVGEAFIAHLLGLLPKKELERQNNLIARLEVKINFVFNPNELISLMRRDKKAKNGRLYFVLPTQIGKIKTEQGQIAFEADESIVRQALSYLHQSTSL